MEKSITKIFDQIKNDGYDKVLAITISSGLSGTNNVVRLVAQEQEGIQTHVLDTQKYWYWRRFYSNPSRKMDRRWHGMGHADR